MLAGRGKDGGHALDRGGIGHGAALVLDDAIGAEVEFEFAAGVPLVRCF